MEATITIKKIFENEHPKPHKIIDMQGGEWKIFKEAWDELNLKETATYELKYKHGKPYNGRVDNIIESATRTAEASQANGHAQARQVPAPTPNREKKIEALALIKGFQASGQVALDEDKIADALMVCYKGWNKFLVKVGLV